MTCPQTSNTCPIGYGAGACPACCFSKELLCDYPFTVGQPGETGKPVEAMQARLREWNALGREFSVKMVHAGEQR
jgi:hypothetical protein